MGRGRQKKGGRCRGRSDCGGRGEQSEIVESSLIQEDLQSMGLDRCVISDAMRSDDDEFPALVIN